MRVAEGTEIVEGYKALLAREALGDTGSRAASTVTGRKGLVVTVDEENGTVVVSIDGDDVQVEPGSILGLEPGRNEATSP